MINLIEYKPSYAKAVAEMWRKSAEGWNGFGANTTEESVLKELEGNTSLNLYLAESNGEILGYCDFSQYLEDEGALYIKLLNVRYDCHGKGIGRTLVCKSVERTVELGWPRLDLYTWPGNTKSIPLYKRCGFFFEDRDDRTHLMNFIPYAINTEAVKEFFGDAHWYKNLKRTINMEPDGRKENGFNFYEYLWEKDGKNLRMEFEGSGRGLRLIETDDYIISASISQHALVFGQKYNITYDIINKSGKELEISIKGSDNKNIKFNYETFLKVSERECVQGEFYIGEFEEEPNSFKTHPAVISEMFINGKRAEFKLGIVPKLPAKISLVGNEGAVWDANVESYKDSVSKMYLDIENSFDEEATFIFTLDGNKDIEFINKEYQIEMKGKEKKSIEVSYMLRNYLFYSQPIMITSLLKDGRKLQFERTLTSAFMGREGVFGGEAEDYFIVANGPYLVKLSKMNNKMYIRGFEKEQNRTGFNFPKLGKPYNAEFSNIKAYKVTWFKEEENIVLKASYFSEQFKGIEVTSVIKLSSKGIVEHYYEVSNNSQEIVKELWVVQSSFHDLTAAILPMDNKFVEIKHSEAEDIEGFNLENLTENWIFSKTKGAARGLSWNKNLKPKMSDWLIGFEHSLGSIYPKETVATEPIMVAINTFNNWQDFRKYVLKEEVLPVGKLVGDLEISINNDNPFVKDSFAVKIEEHKQSFLAGEIRISSEKGGVCENSKTLKTEEEIRCGEMIINMGDKAEKDILTVEADLNYVIREKKTVVFKIKDMLMKEELLEEEGHKVYSLNNGVMTIKASPSFSPALYSMVYKNHDWLETSFPIPKCKSWFNPWMGGILNLPDDLSFRSALEEKTAADFVNLKDTLGNEWRGIRTSFCIDHNDDFKGLEINQYFLMLPGVPVVCHTTELLQNTGRYMKKVPFTSLSFFKIADDIKNNYLLLKNREGEVVRYRPGREAADVPTNGSILYGCGNLKENLQVYTSFEKVKTMAFINIHDTACFIEEAITAANNERVFTTPVFYILTEGLIEDKLLKDLRNIYFE